MFTKLCRLFFYAWVIIFSFSHIAVAKNNSNRGEYAFTCPITGSSVLTNGAEFDHTIQKLLQQWQLPGASITIIHNNKVIINRGYGWANIEKLTPIQPDSIFRIASVSKTLTAIAILQLVQENKLHLDDGAFKILNDLTPLAGDKKAKGLEEITIRHLLQMSSGWYTDRPQDYEPTMGPWSNSMLVKLNYAIPPDCQTAARLMISEPLQFKPGTQYSYSNLNYCLMGLIINKTTNTVGANGYEQYIKQKILAPNNINSMQIGSTSPNHAVAKEVTYYIPKQNGELYTYIDHKLDGTPYGTTEFLKKNYADGGWIASSIDLAKLLQALYQHKIINAASFQMMTTPQSFESKTLGKNAWHPAFGWDDVKVVNNHRYWIKTGSLTGTQALVMLSDDGTSYVALFNAKPQSYAEFIPQLRDILLSATF